MKLIKLLCALSVLYALVCVCWCGPQRAGVRVNNNALFSIGAGLLIGGLAYHAGRQSAIRDPYYRPPPPPPPYHPPYRYHTVQTYYVSPYYYRYRRDVQALNEVDPRVVELFNMALEKDTTGCVLQLTCTIGSMPPSTLTGHAQIMHAIISSPPEKTKGGSLKGKVEKLEPYRTALEHGREGGNCEELFPHCTTSPQQLLHTFQVMKAPSHI